jgi:biofilm PGA synthesis N-glycosyltransferase PgaC
MNGWIWIFWGAVAFLSYTFVGYPALVWLWSKLRKSPERVVDPDYTPMVSVILTVRNEQQHVAHKLRDLLDQDYPADRLEIWAASDSSTDRTDEIIQEFAADDPRVHYVRYDDHIGKAEVLNRTVPRVNGEIVISVDVRQRVEPCAVRNLVRNFADPKVGIVGAERVLVKAGQLNAEECTGLYWRFEKTLRRLESKTGLLTGVAGCFLGFRKAEFRPVPAGSYCEDVTLCIYARQRGQLVVWEPETRSYETMRHPSIEFGRKVRTLVGNYQLMSQFWPVYMPWTGSLSFTLLSHKVTRLFIPEALALLFVASIALAPVHSLYVCALAVQVAMYTAGCLALAREELRRNRFANACGTLCMLSWAALVASAHVLRHGPRIAWRA